jgi:hypothetical protein
MKKKRFSMGEMVAVLKQAELGVPLVEVIRKVGSANLPSTHGRMSRAEQYQATVAEQK